jgi:MFS family permease
MSRLTTRRPPLVLIFVVTLTGILNNTLVSPAIPDILDEFGQESARSGVLVAAGSTAGIVLAPLIGFLADRYGRRRILTACLVVFGAFGGVSALAPSFEVLLAARFLQGFGSAGLINLAIVLIGDHWSGAERTRNMGRNSASLTVGLATLPVLSGWITEAFGWRFALALYALSFATAGWTWLRVIDGDRPPPRPIREQLSGAFEVARRPVAAVTIVLGFLIFVMVFGVFLAAFPVHLAEEFGLEAGTRGILLALPAVTSTIAAFNLARIRRALSVRSVVAATSGVLALAFVLLGLGPVLLVAAAGALLYGFGEGALIPTLQDLLSAESPDAHRGSVIALWVGAVRLGQTAGSLLAAVGISLVGAGVTMVFGAGVAALVLIIGVAGPYRHLSETA